MLTGYYKYILVLINKVRAMPWYYIECVYDENFRYLWFSKKGKFREDVV